MHKFKAVWSTRLDCLFVLISLIVTVWNFGTAVHQPQYETLRKVSRGIWHCSDADAADQTPLRGCREPASLGCEPGTPAGPQNSFSECMNSACVIRGIHEVSLSLQTFGLIALCHMHKISLYCM